MLETKIKEWRLVEVGKNRGIFNTNLDQAIRESVEQGKSPPTLMFTEWKPTVSIGVIESLEKDVNLKACASHNVGVVRRLSGGNSVYLDEGYIVFSLIAPMTPFYNRLDKTGLCRDFCNVVVTALKKFQIPAEFYEPDNIIIRRGDNIQTVGNSGQRIGNVFYAHGSIRYELRSFDVFLDVLKINGHSIHEFGSDIKKVLGEVKSYDNSLTKERIKEEIVSCFSKKNNVTFKRQKLTKEEIARTIALSGEQEENGWLNGRSDYNAKGICYLFLKGNNLVPSLQQILPYSRPSPPEEGSEIYA